MLAVSVCGEQGKFPTTPAGGGGGGGSSSDVTSPVVVVTFPTPAAGTVQDITDSLKFAVKDSDNVKLALVKVVVGGIGGFVFSPPPDSSTFTATAVVFTKSYILPLPKGAAGHKVVITATATDASGNPAIPVVDTIALVDHKPPVLTMGSLASSTVGAGDTVKVIATALDPSGVARMGAEIYTLNQLNRPVVLDSVSRTYAQALATKIDTFKVPVPQATHPGSYLVQVFAVDSAPAPANADSTTGVAANVVITLSPKGSFVPPLGGANVAAGDSLLVNFQATDSAGIKSIVFQGFKVIGNAGLGTSQNVTRFITRSDLLALPDSTTLTRYLLPVLTDSTAGKVYITATVTNSGDKSATITDSVMVVGGPSVSVTAPATGARQNIGLPLAITVSALDPSTVDTLGFVAHGAVRDSQVFAVSPATANATHAFSTPVGAAVAPGTVDSILPFAVGVSHARFVGKPVIVTFADTIPPTITKQGPSLVDTVVTAGDSVLVKARVQDYRGVTAVTLSGVAYRGSAALGTLTAVTRYTPKTITLASKTDTTLTRYLNAVPTDSTVEPVYLVYVAQDSSGNTARDSIRIQVANGPFVRVTKPPAGGRLPVGAADSVALSAFSRDSIKVLGFTATGAVPGGDSSVFVSPLAIAQTTTRFLTSAANAPLGVDTVVPFATTGLGKRFTGAPIVVTFADTVKPGVTLLLPSKVSLLTVAVGDSVLVRVHVTDNRGVTKLSLTGQAKRGVDSLGTTNLVDRYVAWSVTLPKSADTTVTRYLVSPPKPDSTGEFVYIVASATDSSGNTRADTSLVRVVSGPRVSVFTPATNAVTSPSKQLTITVHAQGGQGVKVLGYRAAGVFNDSNSTIAAPVNGKLLDTLTYTNTVTIPVATAPGTFAITAFAVDSTGNPSATIPGVVVTVQPIGVSDTTPPLVQFTVPARVEAGDSINVTATDPSGILKVGFLARDSAGTIFGGDSVTFGGAGTYVSHKFRLALDTVTTFPRVVTVEAFGVDNAATPNRGVSSFSGIAKASPADRDTLTLVAGSTIAFLQGGQFGDAIVNPNRNELYLTNTLLDQIEVFQLNSNTFAAPIRVGSQPVGIALWPRDTLGHNRDTVIVANTGGTNLSLVNVGAGAAEFQRHKLPNYIVSTVKTQPSAAGAINVLFTPYDLSDRPQFVAATCRHLAAGVCDSVLAVYSTTPTPAATGPFARHGYLAWENLTAPLSQTSGHLFWELAATGTDTIQIDAVRDTLPGQALRYTILGAGVGQIVTLSTLAFQESTFVRNSGDFNHAVVGEGGLNQGFARALTFDARRPLIAAVGQPPCLLRSPTDTTKILAALNCDYVIDPGVSSGTYISDFVVNRASRVLSVATNYNGATNLVRADSIYAFDGVLKQAGVFQVGGTNPGMDFDPNNSFDATTRTSGSLNKNDRLVFAARPDAGIDVFDEYWYQRVATIPIRDTIIGPIRVASSGGVLVLVGVTSRGLVVVRLPNFTNPFPGGPARPPVYPAQRPVQGRPASVAKPQVRQ